MDNKDFLSESNRLKALAGSQLTKYIEKELSLLEERGVIKKVQKDVNFKHSKFTYEKQFLANFLIQTFDEKYIIVRSSNSFRSDRAKIGLYDLDGIQRFSNISDEIIASIYLVPDKEKEDERNDFNRTREKINKKEYYSPASHLLTLTEFISFLEEYEYETVSTLDVETDEYVVLGTIQEQGSFYGRSGNEFERKLVKILSSRKNLKQLQNDKLKEGHIYKLIVTLISQFHEMDIQDIIKITATNSIPLLKNGGNPKTDIKLEIETSQDKILIETISVKNTSKKRVTCHDYAAKDFVRVLDCEGTRLGTYLELFQEFPTYRDFQKNFPKGFSLEEFQSLLHEKQNIFIEWVLTGEHDFHNLISSEIQVSRFLLIRNSVEEKLSFFSMKNYITLLKERATKKFGVPFSWTYPSKQRGKRIQLKVPIYFE